MAQMIMETIQAKTQDPSFAAIGQGDIGIFIAGPIDRNYRPSITSHHWDIATLTPVGVLGLVFDLDRDRLIDEERKLIFDSHGWLTLSTRGRRHTLGVLIVVSKEAPNLMTPLVAKNGGRSYLPVVVTFIGRHGKKHPRNVITQWHEDLLKFVIGVIS